MKIEIDRNGNKVLKVQKEKLFCLSCKAKEAKKWYYCEQDKGFYCSYCQLNYDQKTCSPKYEHQDIAIDDIIST